MRPRFGAALAVVAIAACSGGGSGSPSSSAGAASPSSAGASADASPAAPSPGAGTFVNPVLRQNFPDPHIVAVDGHYYAFATGDFGHRFQAARSTDLVEWEVLGDAMPQLPAWASGDTWAPEVVQIGSGFVMYFTARAFGVERVDLTASQCLGVATASAPEGPYADGGDEPFLCQPELGGTIDATVFRDRDDRLFLVYKNDGNCCGIETRFYGRELAADGLSFVGEEVDLGVSNDAAWEGNVIEAPTVLDVDDRYVLLYSANSYAGADYAVGYASAEAPLGPYVDGPENPILATLVPALGPGHQAVVEGPGGDLWLAYHAWDPDLFAREMWIDRLTFEGGRPVVHGPSAQPQPVP